VNTVPDFQKEPNNWIKISSALSSTKFAFSKDENSSERD